MEVRVGVPHMGNFYIAFETLVRELGIIPVIPPRPSRASIEFGISHSPEFICFPFKATLGDLKMALELGANTLVWFESAWSCRFGYYGRLQHRILKDLGYEFNSLILSGNPIDAFRDTRKVLKFDIMRFVKAVRIAYIKSKAVELTEKLAFNTRPFELNRGDTTRVERTALQLIRKACTVAEIRHLRGRIVGMFKSIPVDRTRNPLKIWLVGEIYMVLEPEANLHIVEYLGEHGVLVRPFTTIHNWTFRSIRAGRYGPEGEAHARKLAKPYLPYCLGGEEQLSIGYTIMAKRKGYDGVIHLHPFTCMPENIAYPILQNLSTRYDIPLLSISLDEHTESVGLLTRVEAFLDLLQQRHTNG
ncbi:CoA protein activase [candidate division bacterium WOR-3 4484_18]|uniref:CoA protein activase n=1 Tax=candidate division WOR-3 bacterium 4484_18 TaxID=2020626 RepID=A0A257LUW6_UNCW3|nr:MAG: CoA protein activase [candidate division bacterium WOR-3 4484_18]